MTDSLLEGMLLVSSAPTKHHQVVSAELFSVLKAACAAHLLALFAPLG